MNKSDFTSTANDPVPAVKAVSISELDELVCDMAASMQLLQAAVELSDPDSPNGNGPLYAVITRALEELRGQHEVLCAML